MSLNRHRLIVKQNKLDCPGGYLSDSSSLRGESDRVLTAFHFYATHKILLKLKFRSIEYLSNSYSTFGIQWAIELAGERTPKSITLGMHEGAAAPSYSIRRTSFAGSRSGPSGRFLYHFPTVTEGDRKMMQLRKMKNSFS